MSDGILVFVGGTDPSGGAGLAADIRSASAMGMHGCPVVSAVTVQDTGGVSYWKAVDPDLLTAQLNSVIDDGRTDGIKSGMLGSAGNVSALADTIRDRLPGVPYVLDPVLASGAGDSLSDDSYTEPLIRRLVPLCTLVTPNLSEAGLLSGMECIDSVDAMSEAGKAILSMGAGAVLVKGGHLEGEPTDVLVTREGSRLFRGTRITGETVHGTGCTLAGACASLLGSGCSLVEAVEGARRFVERAISRRIRRLHGSLPGHFPLSAPLPEMPDGSSFYLPPAYCSMCGSAMNRTVGDEGHLHCGRCGFIHYRNPLPAVALLLREDDRVLLVRRAVPPGKGMLCLPGGFMEMGETPGECGRRELMEETGLLATESRLIELDTDTTIYGSILLAVLEVTGWTGTPRPGDDASEVLWKTIGDVPPLAFTAHDRIVRTLAGRTGN